MLCDEKREMEQLVTTRMIEGRLARERWGEKMLNRLTKGPYQRCSIEIKWKVIITNAMGHGTS